MKKLKLTSEKLDENSFWEHYSDGLEVTQKNKHILLDKIDKAAGVMDKFSFYPMVGDILTRLGCDAIITRDGDTNNRADAYIKSATESIPIEIKSPTEVAVINIKSIRQALENKIILLSRKFYPTQQDTSTLAIGYRYPEERSEIPQLIHDFHKTYGISVGYVTLNDLLLKLWQKDIEKSNVSPNILNRLKGQFNEKN